MQGTELGTWKVSSLSLQDNNKHKYWVLFCTNCGNILPARADHIKRNEIISCDCQVTGRNQRGIRTVAALQRRPNGWIFGPVAQG